MFLTFYLKIKTDSSWKSLLFSRINSTFLHASSGFVRKKDVFSEEDRRISEQFPKDYNT
jgi:hypothetical protein